MSSEMEVNNEFSGESGQSDLTLIVEDHKIPVSKAVLCIASPVFCTMLEGDFQEKSMNEIPLPGKSYVDILEFLRCIYPDKLKQVTEKNVYQLLPLAHEYQAKKIEKRCEKVLIQIVRVKHKDTCNVMELYRHIFLSETAFLENLKKVCIYLASEHKLHQFQAAKLQYQISDDYHYKIIELALHRRELDSDDDKHFAVDIEGKESSTPVGFRISTTPGVKPYHDTIKLTLTESIKAVNNRKNCLRALRLSKRYNITEGGIRSKFIKKLKGMSNRRDSGFSDEFVDEFNSLPEEIKLEYQGTKSV